MKNFSHWFCPKSLTGPSPNRVPNPPPTISLMALIITILVNYLMTTIPKLKLNSNKLQRYHYYSNLCIKIFKVHCPSKIRMQLVYPWDGPLPRISALNWNELQNRFFTFWRFNAFSFLIHFPSEIKVRH